MNKVLEDNPEGIEAVSEHASFWKQIGEIFQEKLEAILGTANNISFFKQFKAVDVILVGLDWAAAEEVGTCEALKAAR